MICTVQRRRAKRKQADSIGLVNEKEFYEDGQPRELEGLELDSGLREMISTMGYQLAGDVFSPSPLHGLLFMNTFVEKVK